MYRKNKAVWEELQEKGKENTLEGANNSSGGQRECFKMTWVLKNIPKDKNNPKDRKEESEWTRVSNGSSKTHKLC